MELNRMQIPVQKRNGVALSYGTNEGIGPFWADAPNPDCCAPTPELTENSPSKTVYCSPWIGDNR
jgi:hypothetical protein